LIERKLTANEKPLIIFQQLQKEGRNPLFMLRHVGKGRSEDRGDDSSREYRNGSARGMRDDDPTTPKTAGVTTASDGHGRYA
jgi:hypothetical protein